jgi:hypothetical protein
MKKDITKDFTHLSQAISMSEEPILYELVEILKNCLEDPGYKEIAEQNLIVFISLHKKVENSLKNIVNSDDNALIPFKSIANKLLEKSSKA